MINIGGLHRSGTTLAQFMIGAHPDCIALGEVDIHLEQLRPQTRCSCGSLASECLFWGDVHDRTALKNKLEREYPTKRIVTSNKTGVANLSMVRDVRGWATSVGEPTVSGYLRWYQANKHRQNTISYERLVFDTEKTLKLMCARLGLTPEINWMMRYGDAEHHAVRVNRMAGDSSKMGRISYDATWMGGSQWPASVLPWVMKLNKRLVYSQRG